MGALSITGIKPGSTSLKLTAGKITKTVPITVLSRNLLSYGPAEGNGLTVTVAQDGSLDFSSGTESVPLYKGVRWEFDVPEGIVGVPLIISYTGDVPGSLVIGIYANANSLGGVYQGKNNIVFTIPKGTTRVELRILRGGVTAGSVSGNLKIQLELGNTAHDWMRPDNTSLRGGGGELANLYPRVTGLPKTLGTDPGVMVTEPSPGTYRFKGSTTQKVDSWDSLTCSVHVDAGTYTLDASDWPYDSISWLIGIQSTLTPDDGSGQTIAFEPKGYGPRPLKVGTLRCNIFVNTTGEVDKTFTPRLYKID